MTPATLLLVAILEGGPTLEGGGTLEGELTLEGGRTLEGEPTSEGGGSVDGGPTLEGERQNSPRVALLEQAGWDALKAGQPAVAADAFTEAIALDAKNATLRLGAGMAASLRRHDAEARAHFEQALILDPKLSIARLQIAQLYRRQGDLNAAIRELAIVAGELPGDASVHELLARWTHERDLHDRMRIEVGEFFTVSFEGPEDAALAAQAIESLTKAYWRIGDLFNAYPTKSIPVVLYTREQFRDVTRSPQWAAAVYDGIIRVPMRGAGEKAEDLDRVLSHEFAHALIRSLATRTLPTWLNEGLASVLESDDLGWAAHTVSKAGFMPSLARLTPPFSKLNGAEAQLAYAASALAARRLLDEAGGVAVGNLLRDLGNGVDFDTAFQRRIQKSLAEFEAALGQ
jgi:tetratricopeptide (TPR) repeat protein